MVTEDQLSGFGNEHSSEYAPGTLPTRGNSPRQPANGLFTEQISGSAFTAPRATNLRTWVYRYQPSVRHLTGLTPASFPQFVTAPDPNATWLPQSRWSPESTTGQQRPDEWLASVTTVATNGSAQLQTGGAIHVYSFAASETTAPVFVNADAEMMLIPQAGTLQIETELGPLTVAPAEIALIPRGIKVRVTTTDDYASGWVAENYGQPLQLPDPGVVGVNALAFARDFLYPNAAPAADLGAPTSIVLKSSGQFVQASIPHSPFDVVAWRGNYAPCTYDLRLFCPLGPVLFDHPDPSLGTVLTSPSDRAGTANIDFVVFRERWLVAEETFRPPWYHSNTMSEFMGIVDGTYDARPSQLPGTMTLHNQFMPHGPTLDVYDQASKAEDTPQRLEPTLTFMLESRYQWNPTHWAATTDRVDSTYPSSWT